MSNTPSKHKKKFWNTKNINTALVLLAVLLGFIVGIIFPNFMLSIRWVGEVFFNMLKMLVLPLIFSALVSAIASMNDLKKLGAIGRYTFSYVLINVSFAVFVGLILFNFLKPGVGIDPALILGSSSEVNTHTALTFDGFMIELFPSNILAAAIKFEIMPIVLFALAFAIACASCGPSAKVLIDSITGLRNVLIRMITWVIALSPIGIFSLLGTGVADSVKSGHLLADLKGLGFFLVVFISGLIIQFIAQMIVIKIVARKHIRNFMKSTSSTLITAFGTSSSLATLPMAMSAMEKEHIREDVNRFVLPFTATINLAGTVMYEASAAIFFAQILAYHLSLGQQIVVFVTSIIAGMGAAGIPESGLITMVTVLRAVNIPVSAISLLLPMDRILDRLRTMTNTWGNMCCAVVVNELIQRKEKALLLQDQNSESLEKIAS